MIQNTIYSSSHICVSQVAFFKYSFCGLTARTGCAWLKDTLHLTVINGDHVRTACDLMYEDQLLHDVASKTKACGQFTTRSAKVLAVMRNWVVSTFGNNYIKKVPFFAFVLFYGFTSAYSQKHDYNWVLGTRTSKPNVDTIFSNSLLDFGKLPVKAERKYYGINMSGCNTTMSDSSGKLLFFTNGDNIVTPFGKMENSDSLTDVLAMDKYRGDGYIFPQTILALPLPESKNQYILLHQPMEESTDDFYSTGILKSVIDMTYNNGAGKVIEKNTTVLTEKSGIGMLSACKHANGRDWWLLYFPYLSKRYHRFLIDPRGINQLEDGFGTDTINCTSLNYQQFTNDGTKFIRYTYPVANGPSLINVFNFDRCSGMLSDQKKLKLQSVVGLIHGCAVSPNSRFFYAMTGTTVDQIDLNAADPSKSVLRVADYDGFVDLFSTTFFHGQLAPDGRIYFSTLSGSRILHVIEKPDVKGVDCAVKQHSFQLYGVNNGAIPNHPNYRLGPLKGSPCDTITVATKELTPTDYGLKIFPNPATEQIQIDITLPNYEPTTKTEVVLVDVSGEIVQKYTMPDFAYLATLDISKLASGVYAVQLRQQDRLMAMEKLVVVR